MPLLRAGTSGLPRQMKWHKRTFCTLIDTVIKQINYRHNAGATTSQRPTVMIILRFLTEPDIAKKRWRLTIHEMLFYLECQEVA
jgi:hypothetical protein